MHRLGLRMKFKTLFMSDDIGRLDCSPLIVAMYSTLSYHTALNVTVSGVFLLCLVSQAEGGHIIRHLHFLIIRYSNSKTTYLLLNRYNKKMQH